MLGLVIHILRAFVDLFLFCIFLYSGLYDISTAYIVAIFIRIFVAHGTRVAQHIVLDELIEIGVGAFGALIKVGIDSYILYTLLEDRGDNTDFIGSAFIVVVIGLLFRNVFESLSICSEISDSD